MKAFGILFAVALAADAIGFYKYIYFISLGYGLSVAAAGAATLLMSVGAIDAAGIIECALLIATGLRLGAYLLRRELKSASYRRSIRPDMKQDDGMAFGARAGLWLGCALMFACQVSPVMFRIRSGVSSNVVTWLGCALTAVGVVLETAADVQKSLAKRRAPDRFVDTGLYAVVRCPNYLGQIAIWTGAFLFGLTALHGVGEWLAALFGYAGILYVMFSGARRLELRQSRNYKDDPEYRAYAARVPILLPLVPLYSLAKYEWLRA